MKKYEEIINLFTNFNLSFSDFDIKIKKLIDNTKNNQKAISDNDYLKIMKTILENKDIIYNDGNNYLDLLLYRFIKVSYYFNVNKDINELIIRKLNSLENKKELISLLDTRFINFHNKSFTNKCYLELKMKLLIEEENQEFLIYEIKKDMFDVLNKNIEKLYFIGISDFNNELKNLLKLNQIDFIESLEITNEFSLKITSKKKYENFINNKENQINFLKILDILLIGDLIDYNNNLKKHINMLKINFEKDLISSKIKPNLNNNIKGINKL